MCSGCRGRAGRERCGQGHSQQLNPHLAVCNGCQVAAVDAPHSVGPSVLQSWLRCEYNRFHAATDLQARAVGDFRLLDLRQIECNAHCGLVDLV